MGLNEAGEYIVHDIFLYDSGGLDEKGKVIGRHYATGNIPSFLAEAKAQGYTVGESLFKTERH